MDGTEFVGWGVGIPGVGVAGAAEVADVVVSGAAGVWPVEVVSSGVVPKDVAGAIVVSAGVCVVPWWSEGAVELGAGS